MKKKRKRRYNVHRKRKYLLISLLVVFVFLGIGYSFLSVDLNISGNFAVKKYYAPTLYNVLKKEIETNGLAREYTGEHDDSFTETGTEKIYHWYAENDTEGTQILDKNNVIFANHCWQMIRTTDTGGVKLIYNGEVENNKCLNTRGNHPGYRARTTQTLLDTYYYGTSYTYNKTNNNFTLSGTVSTGTIQTGQYTCMRTTDTGTCITLYYVDSLDSGTTYNVIPINTASIYSQFGLLQFNPQVSSPADVGYMYNTRYAYNARTMTNTENILKYNSLSTSDWYAHEVVWHTINWTRDVYSLVDPYQVSSADDYPNLVGEYTFHNSTQTYTSQEVHYIVAVSSSGGYYYFHLTNSGNHTLADFNYTYTYGDNYTDNGNGTYTINNSTTINRIDWYTSYSNIENKYVCKNATNDTCSELWYVTTTSALDMTYIKVENNYKYAKGFTYDSNTNTYILNNDSVSFWNIKDSTNQTSLNNAHYTCWNSTGECTTLSYIYFLTGITPYYIDLTDGKGVEDALDEMLASDNVNQTNSTIKTGIDAWYENYLIDYSSYLEDTIYCNDRSISELNGWNPDGGNVISSLKFENYDINGNLSCNGEANQFSTSNNKAKLTYPVGLMTSGEMHLLNNGKARISGSWYWLSSPLFFNGTSAGGCYITPYDGNRNYAYMNSVTGVRPAISLKPGTEYSSGDGSMNNPYVVKMN